jgi:hypothetical protein
LDSIRSSLISRPFSLLLIVSGGSKSCMTAMMVDDE